METARLVGLFTFYGFDPVKVDKAQRLVRFQGESTFVDFWNSEKKGMTLGVYDPRTGAMRFHRKLSIQAIEDILITISK